MKFTDGMVEWFSLRLPFTATQRKTNIMHKNFKGVKTVLDLGCGSGQMRIYREYDSTGIDMQASELNRAITFGNLRKLLCWDIRHIIIPDKDYDAVTAFELIEHLTEEDGITLLNNMERMARKVVVISTPYGEDFIDRHKVSPHLSAWYPEDFKARGYKIYPLYNIRWRVANNWFFTSIHYVLCVIGRPLLMMYPDELCNNFVAVKRL